MLASFALTAFLGALISVSLAEEGKWKRKADIPTSRAWFATSVVDGKIYAIGGCPRPGPINRSSIVEEYDIGPAPPETPRSVKPAGKLVTVWGRLKAI
jgi:hypothetical protein